MGITGQVGGFEKGNGKSGFGLTSNLVTENRMVAV